ncbi:hypothetical protein PR048_024155 [Dryococelus australis]|uniref:Uncharacterized protein n=1 Tax=Dryococelus australis TaxID=614101 RepID=A0ABQ9GW32_9NEOP|nr:hypothetical protein PR048_024155 [Dryococelus australis]
MDQYGSQPLLHGALRSLCHAASLPLWREGGYTLLGSTRVTTALLNASQVNVERFRWLVSSGFLEAMRVKQGGCGAAPECKGVKREIPEETRRPEASLARFPHANRDGGTSREMEALVEKWDLLLYGNGAGLTRVKLAHHWWVRKMALLCLSPPISSRPTSQLRRRVLIMAASSYYYFSRGAQRAGAVPIACQYRRIMRARALRTGLYERNCSVDARAARRRDDITVRAERKCEVGQWSLPARLPTPKFHFEESILRHAISHRDSACFPPRRAGFDSRGGYSRAWESWLRTLLHTHLTSPSSALKTPMLSRQKLFTLSLSTVTQSDPLRWIWRRRGPVYWPARSPDLNTLDYWLWGHMKDCVVYATLVNDISDLAQGINSACAAVTQVSSPVHNEALPRLHIADTSSIACDVTNTRPVTQYSTQPGRVLTYTNSVQYLLPTLLLVAMCVMFPLDLGLASLFTNSWEPSFIKGHSVSIPCQGEPPGRALTYTNSVQYLLPTLLLVAMCVMFPLDLGLASLFTNSWEPSFIKGHSVTMCVMFPLDLGLASLFTNSWEPSSIKGHRVSIACQGEPILIACGVALDDTAGTMARAAPGEAHVKVKAFCHSAQRQLSCHYTQTRLVLSARDRGVTFTLEYTVTKYSRPHTTAQLLLAGARAGSWQSHLRSHTQRLLRSTLKMERINRNCS